MKRVAIKTAMQVQAAVQIETAIQIETVIRVKTAIQVKPVVQIPKEAQIVGERLIGVVVHNARFLYTSQSRRRVVQSVAQNNT